MTLGRLAVIQSTTGWNTYKHCHMKMKMWWWNVMTATFLHAYRWVHIAKTMPAWLHVESDNFFYKCRFDHKDRCSMQYFLTKLYEHFSFPLLMCKGYCFLPWALKHLKLKTAQFATLLRPIVVALNQTLNFQETAFSNWLVLYLTPLRQSDNACFCICWKCPLKTLSTYGNIYTN